TGRARTAAAERTRNSACGVRPNSETARHRGRTCHALGTHTGRRLDRRSYRALVSQNLGSTSAGRGRGPAMSEQINISDVQELVLPKPNPYEGTTLAELESLVVDA